MKKRRSRNHCFTERTGEYADEHCVIRIASGGILIVGTTVLYGIASGGVRILIPVGWDCNFRVWESPTVKEAQEEGGAKRSAMSELARGCDHFLEYRQHHGLQSFKIIYKYLVKPGPEARKLKVAHPRKYVLEVGYFSICCPPKLRPYKAYCKIVCSLHAVGVAKQQRVQS